MTADSVSKTAPAIALVGVSKSFGSRVALREASLEVRPGEIAGLVGLNGAGKTTAIRVALGLLAPSSGLAHILGAPYRDSSDCARVGALVDRPALYGHMTPIQNLRLFGLSKGLRGQALDAAVSRVADDFGVTSYSKRRVRELSTGMRQRIGLALAFLGKPDVIVLDEPTEGLDPEGVASLREAVSERASAGAAILFSSHLLSEVETLADRTIIFRDGETVADQPTQTFREASSIRVVFDSEATTRAAFDHLQATGWSPMLNEKAALGLNLQLATIDGAGLSKELASIGIFPVELHRIQPSLEDVFLQLSAAQARDAGR